MTKNPDFLVGLKNSRTTSAFLALSEKTFLARTESGPVTRRARAWQGTGTHAMAPKRGKTSVKDEPMEDVKPELEVRHLPFTRRDL